MLKQVGPQLEAQIQKLIQDEESQVQAAIQLDRQRSESPYQHVPRRGALKESMKQQQVEQHRNNNSNISNNSNTVTAITAITAITASICKCGRTDLYSVLILVLGQDTSN